MQDAIAIAAQLLHRAEHSQTEVTPGIIVHCTVVYMESGWRSHSRSETDAMGSIAQMEGRSRILSFEERIIDPETEEPVSLEQLLSNGSQEYPTGSNHHRAWGQFLAAHDRE